MGILVGLNVIDCNLCVKEEDLDSQQGVIDFSLYLRSSSRNAEANEEPNAAPATLDAAGQGNMIAVLDQKNYIEELNRHLKCVHSVDSVQQVASNPFPTRVFQRHRWQSAGKGGVTDHHQCTDEGGSGHCAQQFVGTSGRESGYATVG